MSNAIFPRMTGVMATLVAASAMAQDCTPEPVGAMGRFRAFDSIGTTVFTLEGFAGLRVFDATDGDDWLEVSSLSIRGAGSLLTAEGELVCVSMLDETLSGARRIAVVDVSDPSVMSILAEIPAPDRLVALQLADGLLYSLSRSSLDIHDLSDPTTPVLLSRTAFATVPTALAVSGGAVVIVTQTSNALFYDASIPGSPQLVATIGGVRTLSRDEDRVVLAGDSLFRFYELSDPSTPVLLGQISHAFGGEMDSVAYLEGKFVMAGSPDFSDGAYLSSWDVSDPQDPIILVPQYWVRTPEATLTGIQRIGEDVLFITGGPVINRYTDFGISFDHETVFEPEWMLEITQRDGLFYTGWNDGTLRVFADTPTAAEQPLGTVGLGLPFQIIGLADAMLFAVALDGDAGHRVFSIDISDPSSPTLLSSALIPESRPLSTTVESGSLYAVTQVHSSSPPERLYTVRFDGAGLFDSPMGATIPTVASFNSIRARDGLAYIMGSSGFDTQQDLRVYDMSHPATPVLVGSLDLPSMRTGRHFEIVGDTIINKPNSTQLVRINIADPTMPVYQTDVLPDLSVDFNHRFIGVDASEHIALFANLTTLVALNIRNPDSLAVLAEVALPYGRHMDGVVLGRWDGSIFLNARNGETNTDGIFEFALPSCGFEDCPADITDDGNLNFFDLAAYLELFNAGDPAADLAAPYGTINFFDLAAYLDAFGAGCP